MNSDWIAAFEALRSVYIDEAYSNIAINEAISKHSDASAGFVRTFVKGVLRDSIRLDYYISQLASKGLKGIKGRTKIVLRMGLYAIESLDSVPAYAACDEAVKLSKKVSKGTDRFVNAVLRNFVRRQDELTLADVSVSDVRGGSLSKAQVKAVSLAKSFDTDFVRMLNKQYGGEECLKMLDGLNTAPDLIIRTNTLKNTREELIDALRTGGFEVTPCEGSALAVRVGGGSVTADEMFKEGYFSIQSLSSILSIEAFNPAEGSRVLDMCAAPGGKTAAMAEIMGNEGYIRSLDVHKHRCELIDATCARLGIDIVETGLSDATVYEEAFARDFDYVLCDVPCSGLGVISTKPEIKLKKRTDAAELTEIQMAALENAYAYAKSGGRVMYSTCTVNKDENEGVVEHFMEKHPGARIIENVTLMPYNNVIGFFYCIIIKE